MNGSIEIELERQIYANAHGALYDDDVTFEPSGTRGRYVRWAWRAPYSVAVLPAVDDSFALVKVFRHSARRVVLEVPKGFGEPLVGPDHTARRELREETGLIAGGLEHLVTVSADPAFADHPMHLFLAMDCVAGAPSPESTESIEAVVLVPRREILSVLRRQDPVDAISLLIAQIVTQ